MERREFLKLSSLFSIGAIIGSNALKAMESISSLVSPSYIYKVRHRIGFWIVFSTETKDLKNKIDFAEKMEDNLFYKDSLELVEVCEEDLSKDKIEIIKNSLNNTKEVQEKIKDNIKVKHFTPENLSEGSLSKELDENFLYDWWVLTFTEREREIMERGYRPMFMSVGLKINITGDGDNGEKIKIPLGLKKEPVEEKVSPADMREFLQDRERFLVHLGSLYLSREYWDLEERILLKRSKIMEENREFFGDIDFHYLYQNFIRYYYKRREEGFYYVEKAKEYCNNQISISSRTLNEMYETGFLENKGEWASSYLEHVGYTQLCIIEEKEKNYRKILSLIQKARTEGWNGGYTDPTWEKRESRTRKKLNKESSLI
jgi:hypothetical protein